VGKGEYWVTPEFAPVGTPGDLADVQFLVTGFSTMEPALNFTNTGTVSVHLKVAGVSDHDAMLLTQQRFCSVLTPSRYRLANIRVAPAVNNPVGGCFGPVESRLAAEKLVERRRVQALVGTLAFCDIVDSTYLSSQIGDVRGLGEFSANGSRCCNSRGERSSPPREMDFYCSGPARTRPPQSEQCSTSIIG